MSDITGHTQAIMPESWQKFIKEAQLTDVQGKQFEQYLTYLLAANQEMSITTITQPDDIIAYHFMDSLHIGNYIDFTTINSIADVGAGGGFPGIPLKIKYPHIKVVLIEVNNKKVRFLQEVIDLLKLEDIEVCNLDWRTFLRKTTYSIDLFVARASLSIAELMRVLKPGCRYNKAELVYWASADWICEPQFTQYLVRQESYVVKNRKRRFAFFNVKPREGM